MILKAALAGAFALGLAAAAPAAAQDRHDPNWQGDRHDQSMSGDRDRHDMDRGRDRDMDRDHRDDRGGHHWRGSHDNGRHEGWRNNRHCRWTWRHHHRVRVCY
ncbi:MAG: hypothetical protein QOE79_476 [Sphingomonadales bacterium]|jgi:hypothetical protein|nr:hypothetical protein [Sphingomonadales bacterium]